MNPRMKNPVLVFPAALQAMLNVGKSVQTDRLPTVTRKLVHLRASQINGCGLCVDMHAKELRHAEQSEDKVFAVSAWREAPYFTDAERAALALTEAATRLADQSDAVPDAVWNEAKQQFDEEALAALVIEIALINAWNRINATTRQPAGAWKGH